MGSFTSALPRGASRWTRLRLRSIPRMWTCYETSEAIMKECSDHSATVNITQLTTMLSGARPCEPEYLSLEGMQDDGEFNVTKGPLPQIKTKVYSIPPAANHHRSWHVARGDYLVLVDRQPVECEKDGFGCEVPRRSLAHLRIVTGG